MVEASNVSCIIDGLLLEVTQILVLAAETKGIMSRGLIILFEVGVEVTLSYGLHGSRLLVELGLLSLMIILKVIALVVEYELVLEIFF